MKGLLRLYDPALDWALGHRKTVLGLAASLLAVCLVIAFGLPRAVNDRLPESVARHTQGFGSEFMPTLEEGSLLFMPVLLPATALTEVKRIMAWQDQVISAHPAVASAAGKLGRADHRHRPGPGGDDRDHHHAQAPRRSGRPGPPRRPSSPTSRRG